MILYFHPKALKVNLPKPKNDVPATPKSGCQLPNQSNANQ